MSGSAAARPPSVLRHCPHVPSQPTRRPAVNPHLSSPNSAGRAKAPSQLAFLALYGLMFAGVAVSVLDATAITTKSGHGSSGAIWTSVYLAVMLVSIAASVSLTPKVSSRLGGRRVFAGSVAMSSALWLILGSLILSCVRPIPVLLFGAVGVGALWGAFSVLSNLFAKAYLAGEGMAESVARLSVASGLAWAIGSAGGGFLLHAIAPGWGLLLRAVLGVPFALLVILLPPAVEPQMPEIQQGVLSGMRDRLRDNRDLRQATLLGIGIVAFAAPMVSMIVPIVDALRQSPLLPGAGILSAAIAIGELLSPIVVTKLDSGRSNLRAAATSMVVCAGTMVLYGCVSLLFSRRLELGLWVLTGLAFGAFRYGAKALNTGAATASDTEANSVSSLATVIFVTSLAAPIGVLAWGMLINRWSVEAAILLGAVGTMLVSSIVLKRERADL